MRHNTPLERNIRHVVVKLTTDQKCLLWQQWRQGDNQARERLILAYIPMILYLVARFIRKHHGIRHLQDDLTSAGFVALCQAVDHWPHTPHDHNPQGYLYTVVDRHLYDVVDREQTIRIPKRTQQARLASGGATITWSRLPSRILDRQTYLASEVYDVRDLLDACIADALDNTVLTHRESGYTLQEIADALNTSFQTVWYRLHRLEQRVNIRLKNLETAS